MVNFGQIAAEICWRVWGNPANFNRFRVLASLLHRRRSTESTTLCRMFDRLLAWYTIYTFWGLLLPNGILPAAKFTLRPSLAFSYIGCITAWHSSSGRQPNAVDWYKDGITELSWPHILYSDVRPSRLASAHILVYVFSRLFLAFVFCQMKKHLEMRFQTANLHIHTAGLYTCSSSTTC